MAQSQRDAEIEGLAASVIRGMREKKARDIVSLDLRHIPNTVCEFFIICSGDSNTHVEGISGSVQETTRKELKDRPWHVEGMGNSEWVLLDYVNVVAHIFQREPRDFYAIERLWADAILTEHPDDSDEVVFNREVKPKKAAAPAKPKTANKKTPATKKAPAKATAAKKAVTARKPAASPKKAAAPRRTSAKKA
jgi:ribosome-associated protein